MKLKTAKWVFWGGTLSSLAVFGVLTVDTHRQLGALTHAEQLDVITNPARFPWSKEQAP